MWPESLLLFPKRYNSPLAAMQMATSGACRRPNTQQQTRILCARVPSHPGSAGNCLWSQDAMRASYHLLTPTALTDDVVIYVQTL